MMDKLSGTIDGHGTAWVVRYSDHEQAMIEKDARIARLEAVVSDVTEFEQDEWVWQLIDNAEKVLNESPCVSLNNIKADAIDEMVSTFFTDEYQIAELVKKDILDYTNKLRSNK